MILELADIRNYKCEREAALFCMMFVICWFTSVPSDLMRSFLPGCTHYVACFKDVFNFQILRKRSKDYDTF